MTSKEVKKRQLDTLRLRVIPVTFKIEQNGVYTFCTLSTRVDG